MTKISTLNLCLGLPNKTNTIQELLSENKIDIFSMQEMDLTANSNCGLLSIPGYRLEIETNYLESRTGIYIYSNYNYTRSRDFEQKAHI
jgi:hypothetical protein